MHKIVNGRKVPLTELEVIQEEKHEISHRKLKEEYKKVQYKEQRKSEYPEVGDALDAIAKWLATETEFGIPEQLKAWAMTCMSVKAKYPKPQDE